MLDFKHHMQHDTPVHHSLPMCRIKVQIYKQGNSGEHLENCITFYVFSSNGGPSVTLLKEKERCSHSGSHGEKVWTVELHSWLASFCPPVTRGSKELEEEAVMADSLSQA